MKKMYFLLVILCISLQSLYSVEFDKSKLPKLLGANNWGREFYFSFIPVWETSGTNYLKIFISSNVKTKVVVDVPGKGYQKIKYTVPNDIIEFTLSPAIGQPYTKHPFAPPEPDKIFRDAGVHVFADDPIICYGVSRYNYTSDGFLALPVNSLGKDYIIASFADVSSNDGQWLPSMFTVTAAYDRTKVLFTMGGTDWSKTVSGQLPGEKTSWNLNAGDVLLVSSLGTKAELSGSTINADKPVAIVSGNYCAYVPTNCGCCDLLEEMELPTNTWGTEYHVTPIINRLKNSLIKIFAKEPKTNIYRDGNLMGFIKNAGGVQGAGFLDMRADEGSDTEPRPIVFSGDKPISVTQYNTGQLDDGITSDPFQMVLVPTEQYQKDITFNTPGIRGGFGFPQNYLNLCYESDSIGTIPNDLEIASYNTKDSVFEWKTIKDTINTIGIPFTNTLSEKYYSLFTYKLPGDGVYKMRANKPFQAYMYGFSWCDSYGFPASVSLKKLDIIDSLPPKPEWKMDCQGNVNKDIVRYVTDKPDIPVPRANLSMIYMSSDLSFNYKLYYSNFMPCEDISATWRLETIDPTEDARAVVTFADCNGNDSTIVIEYFAPNIKLVDKKWDYGRHGVGEESWHQFHLINFGTASWECTDIKLRNKDKKGDDQGFALYDETKSNGLSFPIVIESGDSLHFWVKFTATMEGLFWDSIGFGDTCFFFYKSYVNSAIGMPIIDVSDWNYPPTIVNSSAFGQFDIKNFGSVNLEIYGYEGPSQVGAISGLKIHASDDLEEKNISEENKLILMPGQTITMNLQFTPDDTLSFPDSIKFISNSVKKYPNGDLIDSVCSMSGRGLKSELKATSYNWERKRIHRDNFPVSPYPALINSINTDSCIQFYNGGNKPTTIVKIKDVKIEGDKNTFIFDRTKIFGSTVNAHSKLVVPVYCQPLTTGYHLYTFEVQTDNPSIKDVQTTLQVTGILAKITAEDVNLGGTEINDFDNPAKINIIINNIVWQFQDSVTISDIECANINTNNNTNWNDISESFRIDKSALKFPIVLQPGETLEIPVEFVAKEMTEYSATITTVSDAEADVKILITGRGAEPGAVKDNKDFINLYPNPTEDILIIDKLPINTSKIQIFDETGKEVRSIDIKNQSESLKISTKDLPVGAYILRMFVGSKVLDRKFVVIR